MSGEQLECEAFDPKKDEHRGECIVCNRRNLTGGAVAFAFGFPLPCCASCIDGLHKAAHGGSK